MTSDYQNHSTSSVISLTTRQTESFKGQQAFISENGDLKQMPSIILGPQNF